MGFRLRFLCPPPWSVVFLGLTGRVWAGGGGGGGVDYAQLGRIYVPFKGIIQSTSFPHSLQTNSKSFCSWARSKVKFASLGNSGSSRLRVPCKVKCRVWGLGFGVWGLGFGV